MPEITPFEFDGVLEAGRDAQLVCYVPRGDPPLDIHWYIDGRDFSGVMGISTMKVGMRSSILTINSVTHKHVGVYTCSVSNPADEVRHSTTLIVHGRFLKRARNFF